MKADAIRTAAAFLLLPALAGCGREPFTVDDGGFDRAGYRAYLFASCIDRIGDAEPRYPQRDAICSCTLRRLMEGRSDEELHALVRGADRLEREGAAVDACAQQAAAAERAAPEPQRLPFPDQQGLPEAAGNPREESAGAGDKPPR